MPAIDFIYISYRNAITIASACLRVGLLQFHGIKGTPPLGSPRAPHNAMFTRLAKKKTNTSFFVYLQPHPAFEETLIMNVQSSPKRSA